MIPVYCLIIAGVWNRRRDVRALVLLAGPLVYFCAVHLVFVSSIRYRIPGGDGRDGPGRDRLSIDCRPRGGESP